MVTSQVTAESASSGHDQMQAGCSTASTSKDDLYCYCYGPEEGSMIACDNKECKIEWFHMICLKMKSTPKGKWYCPDCCLLPQFQRKRKKTM